MSDNDRDNPSTDVPNGHDAKGRFAKGNKLGRGNPLAGRAAKIRAQLLEAATPDDIKAIARALVDGAKAGDLAFIKEFLDRTIGKASPTELLERLEALEKAIAEREGQF